MIFENFDDADLDDFHQSAFDEKTSSIAQVTSSSEEDLEKTEQKKRESEAYERGYQDAEKIILDKKNQEHKVFCNEVLNRVDEFIFSGGENNKKCLKNIEEKLSKILLSGILVANKSLYLRRLREIMGDLQGDFLSGNEVTVTCSSSTKEYLEDKKTSGEDRKISWHLDETMPFPDCRFSFGVGNIEFQPKKLWNEVRKIMQQEGVK